MAAADERHVKYLPLKMLVDKKTEKYVKFAKIMVIFQGPYSNERLRVEEEVGKIFKYCSCVISDYTYRKAKRSICQHETTDEFYDYFKKESCIALEEGNNLLVVNPTMSNLLQNKHFVSLAHKMQYVVLVVPPIVSSQQKENWPAKSQAASYREVGIEMPASAQFQHLFCAWYLHDVDSMNLRHIAKLYMQDCIEDISEFKEMFSSVKVPDDKVDIGMDTETFTNKITRKYFKLYEQWQDLAYCVTKVFNNQLFLGVNPYFKTEEVVKNYGKMSKLSITGFIISPHMVSARVKLSFAQKNLWDMLDEIDENSKVPIVCPSNLFEESKSEFVDVDSRRIASKCNTTVVDSGHPVHDPTEHIPATTKGRACHIVLGKAPDAPSKNVDFDVQFALRRQSKVGKDKMEKWDLERSVVRRIGKYWFIDLKETIIVDGFFASCVKPYAYESVIHQASSS